MAVLDIVVRVSNFNKDTMNSFPMLTRDGDGPSLPLLYHGYPGRALYHPACNAGQFRNAKLPYFSAVNAKKVLTSSTLSSVVLSLSKTSTDMHKSLSRSHSIIPLTTKGQQVLSTPYLSSSIRLHDKNLSHTQNL